MTEASLHRTFALKVTVDQRFFNKAVLLASTEDMAKAARTVVVAGLEAVQL